jgi:hypothetical protein
MSLAGGMRFGHPLREVPVAGTCDRGDPGDGVSLWDKAPGRRCRRGTGCWLTLREDVLFGPT